jgi:hypothetical protein
MTHYYEGLHGWFDWQDMCRLMVEQATGPAQFVEVGSWFGRSAAFRGLGPDQDLVPIVPWSVGADALE